METIKIYSSFILLPSLLSLLQVDAFLLTLVCSYIRPCDTNNLITRLTRMYQHAAIQNPYCLHGAKKPAGQNLGFLSVYARFLDYQGVFFRFFYEVRHRKVRK